MSQAITKAIPFENINGMQVISEHQVCEDPSLMDFINRFPHCFHKLTTYCGWAFYKDGVPEHLTNLSTTRDTADFTTTIDLTANQVTTK